MKVRITGNGLHNTYSEVQVTPHSDLKILVHDHSRRLIGIPLKPNNIFTRNHTVILGTKHRVSGIEHFFSALYGLKLFRLRLDILGKELPILDGSSQPFIAALNGFKPSPASFAYASQTIDVRQRESYVTYTPDCKKSLVIDMKLTHPYIEPQSFVIRLNARNYCHDIAPARTFLFTTDNDPRLRNLPPYGIGVTPSGMFSASPLRFTDELVRHKILDLLGDLYVLGRPVAGKITALNTSHKLNLSFVKKFNHYMLKNKSR